MRKLILPLIALTICSCADALKQQQFLQKKYPNCIVEPATGLIKNGGYDFTVFDTVSNQMYAVSFYWYSESKIWSMKNVR